MSRSKLDPAEVVMMRAAGLSFRAIAKQLGCSQAAAHAAQHRALDKAPPIEDATDLRLVLAQRYEVIYRESMKAFAAGSTRAGSLALRSTTELARLFGLVGVPEASGGPTWNLDVSVPSELMPPAPEDEPVVQMTEPAPEPERKTVTLDSFIKVRDEPIAWEPPASWSNGSNGHVF